MIDYQSYSLFLFDLEVDDHVVIVSTIKCLHIGHCERFGRLFILFTLFGYIFGRFSSSNLSLLLTLTLFSSMLLCLFPTLTWLISFCGKLSIPFGVLSASIALLLNHLGRADWRGSSNFVEKVCLTILVNHVLTCQLRLILTSLARRLCTLVDS